MALQGYIPLDIRCLKDEGLQTSIGQITSPRCDIDLLEGIAALWPGANEEICRAKLGRAWTRTASLLKFLSLFCISFRTS
jgi:hypothetical protein